MTAGDQARAHPLQKSRLGVGIIERSDAYQPDYITKRVSLRDIRSPNFGDAGCRDTVEVDTRALPQQVSSFVWVANNGEGERVNG